MAYASKNAATCRAPRVLRPQMRRSFKKELSCIPLINQFNDKAKQRWVTLQKIEILLSLSGKAPVSLVVKIINWLDWANFHQFSYWLSNSFEIVGLSNRSSNCPNKEKYVLSVGIEHYPMQHTLRNYFNSHFMKISLFEDYSEGWLLFLHCRS